MAHFEHGRTFSDSISDLPKGYGQGQMREVSEGLAVVMVPLNPRSLVVIFAVCVQGRSYVVCQLPIAPLISH